MAALVSSFLLLCLVTSCLSLTERSCGGKLTNVSGVITSPNYPNNYPNGVTCAWKISPEKSHVNLTIEDFMLEDSQPCEEFDFVKIQAKVGYRKQEVALCGSIASRQLSLKVEGSEVEITFKSDLSITARGFKINYRAYDVDPCLNKNGGCSHMCDLVKGKRVCSCPKGYKLKYDYRTCKGEKSCYFVGYQKCPYGTGSRCEDLADGTTTCVCWHGFKKQNGKCQDVNECEEKPGRCGVGKCRNGRGWFTCDCPKGYVYDGTTCKDRDECKNYAPPDCGQATCVNTQGSYICQCAPGYQLNAITLACQDTNECDTGSSGCEHVCTNTEGSYTCSCRPGYFLESNGKTCRAARVEGLRRVRNSMTCQGSSLDISCKEDQQAVIIHKASYGRSRPGVCPYRHGLPENDTDDSTLCEEEVTDKIKALCGWRRACNVAVNSKTLGRVCPGVYKYLTVLYSCAKPVMCPSSLPLRPLCAATEEDECTSDEYCHTSQMCCFDGCKRICALPSLYSADT